MGADDDGKLSRLAEKLSLVMIRSALRIASISGLVAARSKAQSRAPANIPAAARITFFFDMFFPPFSIFLYLYLIGSADKGGSFVRGLVRIEEK